MANANASNQAFINAVAAAMRKGAPQAWAAVLASPNRSAWGSFRDSIEGGLANVLPIVTLGLSPLANKAWSKDAQAGIDPGMQMVLGAAGAIGGGVALHNASIDSSSVDLGTTVTSNGGADVVATTGADVSTATVAPSVSTVTQAASVTEQASTYTEVGYTGTATVAPASYGAVGTAAQEAGALAESAGYAGAATQSAAIVSGGATVPQAVSVGEAAVSAGGKIAGAVVATEVTKAITPAKPAAPVAVAAAPKALIPAPLLFGGLGLGLLFFIL